MPRGSKRQDNGVPTDFFSPDCNTDVEPRVHGGGATSLDTCDIEDQKRVDDVKGMQQNISEPRSRTTRARPSKKTRTTGTQTFEISVRKPANKRIRTAMFLTLEILSTVAAIVLVFRCAEISKVSKCELEKALDSIHLEYRPHTCQYNDIKELNNIPLAFGITYLVFKVVVFAIFTGCKYKYLTKKGQGAKDAWKKPFHKLVATASFLFFLAFLISIVVIRENKEQTNVNYENLGSSMQSWLETHFTSDDLKGGSTISAAWNNFFIQYDCCAVNEVLGTTNDFDNTPWCTTSGSCQATSSQIPKTCCKGVTQNDYQNAPVGCHASVNQGTYKQGCFSIIKTLSVDFIDDSQVEMLFYVLLNLMVFQVLEFCLVLQIQYHHIKQHIHTVHAEFGIEQYF